MRACGFLLLAACSADPSLAIAVHHPDGARVTQTVVTVYFGADVRCSEIAYGDRTPAALAALAVSEVDVTDGGRVEVSRLGGKAIVARGYDADHRFLTAGCQDVGEITEGTKLAIATQPTAVVAIDPDTPERPFAERTIIVNVTDAGGAPLDGVVSWQLTGPAGAPEPPPADGAQTRNGDAEIHVADLGMPGPQGLRIRVPWAIAPLPLVTAFDLSGATMISLGNGAGAPACDVRGHAGGTPTLVCLTPALAGHRNAVEIAWDGAQYTKTAIPLPGDGQLAVFVDHDGSANEPVYVVGQNSWSRINGSSKPITFPGALEAVVYVPGCSAHSIGAVVGVQTAATGLAHKRRFYSVAGDELSPLDDGEVFAGGCMHDVDGDEHQAVVTSGATADAFLTLLEPGKAPATVGSAKLSGAGFVAVQGAGTVEKRFAGTRLQASGTVVFESVLARAGDSYKLVERTEVDCAAPPTKIRGGALDHDGDTDLMWDLGAALRRHSYQVSLAKQVDGAPLTAITNGDALTTALVQTDFAIGNLNGGAADEMIIFTPTVVMIYSAD